MSQIQNPQSPQVPQKRFQQVPASAKAPKPSAPKAKAPASKAGKPKG